MLADNRASGLVGWGSETGLIGSPTKLRRVYGFKSIRAALGRFGNLGQRKVLMLKDF